MAKEFIINDLVVEVSPVMINCRIIAFRASCQDREWMLFLTQKLYGSSTWAHVDDVIASFINYLYTPKKQDFEASYKEEYDEWANSKARVWDC